VSFPDATSRYPKLASALSTGVGSGSGEGLPKPDTTRHQIDHSNGFIA